MSFLPNQPVFFQKLPATEKTPPNAEFKRYMGDVAGEPVVEISKSDGKWIVRASEVLSVEEALKQKATQLQAKIDEQRPKWPRKSDLVKALGICESTFRRWNGLIRNYLPQKEEAKPS